MRVLVAGGAGFIGSHLCRALVERGDSVTVIDNFLTGKPENLLGLDLKLIEADLCSAAAQLSESFEAVVNLASPASPPAYQQHPLATLDVGSIGTRNALEIARRSQARFLMASTSEIYGEPQVHPQVEEYRGNVNTVGPRSMYDEAKRFSEALTTCYREHFGVSTAIVRIFNTYGPQMQADDGRVITNFLSQAKQRLPLTIYGEGTQTRSFCYVSDMVEGLLAMLDSSQAGPINLGNPAEITILQLAQSLEAITGVPLNFVYRPLPGDDPTRRRPNIDKAKSLLNWQPHTSLEEGLKRTWEWIVNN